MKISRTIAYGIHAAVQLARQTGGMPTPSNVLAREGRLPERFLVQILRCLVTNGILKSVCGVSGGYTLTRPPAQITLRDIIESFDSPLEVALADLDCMSPGVRTQVVSTLDDASQGARTRLEKLTLADLLRIEMQSEASVRTGPPSPIGINLHLMESNEYEVQTGDSPVTH